jgi:hypothetical protein
LQVVLADHPAVVTCRETHLFDRLLGPLLDRLRDEEKLLKSNDGTRHWMKRSEMERHLRAMSLTVFDAIHRTRPDAKVVVEKTPDHLFCLEGIQSCLPEVKVIHLIRDPRAVAVSMKAASREPWGWWAETKTIEIAARWCAGMEAAKSAAERLGDRFLELRYEDLLVSGARRINDVFHWLGIAKDESLPTDLRDRYPVSGMAIQCGNPLDPRSECRRGFFRRGVADSWRDELPLRDVALVEDMCASHMSRYGYELSEGVSTKDGSERSWQWRRHAQSYLKLVR